MRSALVIGGVLGVMAVAANAEVTTSVQNGSNSATVTQSGKPADTKTKVERSPGHTAIYQNNKGNSSTIIQESGPAAGVEPDDLEDEPAEDRLPGDKEKQRAELIAKMRQNSGPEARRTLDRLLDTMGLAPAAR